MAEARRSPRDRGFTLIELLIVILVLGILAAIAIPTLVRQREKGWDVAVESDLRNAAIAQDAYLTEGATPGHYATTVAQLQALGFRASADDNYFGSAFAMTVSVSGAQYCLTSRSASGRYLGYSRATGIVVSASPLDPVACS